MTAGEIFGCLFGTFLGSFLFYEGFYRLFVLYRLKKKGQCAIGTVVRREKDGYNTTVPLISFANHSGNKVEGIAKNSVPTEGFSLWDAGDSVKIYYDAFNPNVFAVDGISNKIVCFLATLSGCLFLYAVVVTMYNKLI